MNIHEQEDGARRAQEKAKKEIESHYFGRQELNITTWIQMTVPIGGKLKKSLEYRNRLWETSLYFRDIILKEFEMPVSLKC